VEVLKEHQELALQKVHSFLAKEEDKRKAAEIFSLSDFKKFFSFRGANLHEPGQVEIWKERRRIRTYKFSEIVQNALLFPIISIEGTKISAGDEKKESIVFGLQEKGHLAKYSIHTPQFFIEALRFYVMEIPSMKGSMKVLYKIMYDGKELKSSKDDTAVTGTVIQIV